MWAIGKMGCSGTSARCRTCTREHPYQHTEVALGEGYRRQVITAWAGGICAFSLRRQAAWLKVCGLHVSIIYEVQTDCRVLYLRYTYICLEIAYLFATWLLHHVVRIRQSFVW